MSRRKPHSNRFKHLRASALKRTIGRPWVQYQQHKVTRVIRLAPACGRAVYQQLKREGAQ